MKTPTAITILGSGILAVAGVAIVRFAPGSASEATPKTGAAALLDAGQPIQPIAAGAALDPRRVSLGKKLFSDTRLSKDSTISCASCHDLSKGGADGRRVSIGVDGLPGQVNAPTVLNASLNFKQFWDGRADTLEDQIEGPVTHPSEMGSTWPDIVGRLEADAEYVRAFRATYADGITRDNIKNAIATFERSLITPNSRFDRYLKGDQSALTAVERQGYELFLELGCTTCHQGENVGGSSFQTFGVVGNYFAERGSVATADLGRFNVTGKERDKFKFKVPTLRNIARTGPYFHDGSVATLEDAVRIMARYQLGLQLTENEVGAIVAFLHTLDGHYKP